MEKDLATYSFLPQACPPHWSVLGQQQGGAECGLPLPVHSGLPALGDQKLGRAEVPQRKGLLKASDSCCR